MSEIAPYAAIESNSKGRVFKEKSHPYRGAFERDRDRIIHSSAFRRLEGKTQVFSPGLDDNYRTRLTHSIEVSQVGRTIAKALRLNESLAEAVCLGHDLGHSPFGHCGETVLNMLMVEDGGFEHNSQTMRIVELLEHPYNDFAGLNLMHETRLGLSRHNSPYDAPAPDGFKEKNCTLEGQVANLADRIAYNCHDLEDGLRSRVLKADELMDLELFQRAYCEVDGDRIENSLIRHTRIVKKMVDDLVSDAIEVSKDRISASAPKSLDDVLDNADNLIAMSDRAGKHLREMESYLLANMYRSSKVLERASDVEQSLRCLFERLIEDPELMPGYFQGFIEINGIKRAVCDYIAGMTDRYCLERLNKTGCKFI